MNVSSHFIFVLSYCDRSIGGVGDDQTRSPNRPRPINLPMRGVQVESHPFRTRRRTERIGSLVDQCQRAAAIAMTQSGVPSADCTTGCVSLDESLFVRTNRFCFPTGRQSGTEFSIALSLYASNVRICEIRPTNGAQLFTDA